MTAASPTHLLAAALGNGPDHRPALRGSHLVFSGDRLGHAVEAVGRELDAQFAPGSRVLLATRDQLVFALLFLGSLRSGVMPLLADPTDDDRLRALAQRWGAGGGVGNAACAAGLGTLSDDATLRIAASDARLPLRIPALPTDEAAFWTFTSGTTGESRAIVHGHGGPQAAFEAFGRGVLGLCAQDRTIATAGLPFVYALGNALLFPLMAGATAILPRDLLLPSVLSALASERATVLVSGPRSLDAIERLARRDSWQDALRGLRHVLSAGESLPPALALRWKEHLGGEVLDNLGCTEMFNSFASSRPGETRPGTLGEILPGFEARIDGRPLRPGLRGALSVRGASRALAISDRAGNPPQPPDTEFCETGDEVEITSDRQIVFLGRLDDRFKVQGQFLHPLEVERALADIPGVVEILVEERRDERGLPAVGLRVVAETGSAEATIRERLRRHARTLIPGRLSADAVSFVDALPRSPRGKLLRHAS